MVPSPTDLQYDSATGQRSYEYNPAGTAAIKEQLLNKRGVEIGFHADESFPDQALEEDGQFLSTKNWAHYTWYPSDANHAVQIVGWDDNYPRENFVEAHQPPVDMFPDGQHEGATNGGNGAWLVKNSWGSGEEEFPNKGEGKWGVKNEEGATVEVADQTYTGDPLTPEVTVVLDGVTLSPETDYTVEYSNSVEVGTATVTVTGIGNYTDSVEGTFAIAQVVYAVIVEQTEGGVVAVDKESAAAGAEVTITVTPEEGWELDAISVTTADGEAVEVEDGTFTMPASDVTVEATFKKKDSSSPDSDTGRERTPSCLRSTNAVEYVV